MGGISIFLLFLLLWPVLLAAQFLAFLDIALPTIAIILAVWNGIVLAFLLWLWRRAPVRRLWDRAWLGGQEGGKRILLLLLRWGLLLFTIWEGVLLLACIAYLIWQPSLLGLLL